MWGAGSAFEDFEAFLESMKKRGVSFLEMLAMEMKLEGEHLPLCNSQLFKAQTLAHVCNDLKGNLSID